MIVAAGELMDLLLPALARGQCVRLTVTGSSMQPFIHNYDVVEIEPARVIRNGDIALVRTAGPDASEGLVLHRIVQIREETCFIRGDAQTQEAGPYSREAVVGVCTASWHNGHARNLHRGPWRLAGRAWMFAAPCSVWLLSIFTHIRRAAGWGVRKLRNYALCRKLAASLCPAYTIQEADREELAALNEEFPADDNTLLAPAATGQRDNLTNYVAKRRKKILGMVRLMRHPRTDFPHTGHWIYSLSVENRYRGMGIGEALMRHVIEQARCESAHELFLEVFEDNTSAIALYNKLGFRLVDLPGLKPQQERDLQLYKKVRVPMRMSLQ